MGESLTTADNRFGGALRELRQTLRLSQLDLAKRLGTTQRHLSFLETGRSRPTREMIGRIVTGLSLSVGQRAALFAASGLADPERPVAPGAEAAETLDLLATRVLAPWPYPAFVLDRAWQILRANAKGETLLAVFGFTRLPSMFEVFLAPSFREAVENWEVFSMAFFFRLQAAAATSPEVARVFAEARRAGVFDHVPAMLTTTPAPALVPAILRQPDGSRLALTSIVGGLVTTHDAVVDALQVEFVIPLDDPTAAVMGAL